MTTASNHLRLVCMKKSRSLQLFFLPQNWVFRIFSVATFALRHLCPPSLYAAKKQPGRETPNGFKLKGNERVSERREMLAFLCRAKVNCAKRKRFELLMKRTKGKVTIKELRVLGSYVKMYHNVEVYPHSLRKPSKDVKKSDTTAIAIAALLLSQNLTPNAVLIPVPQSSGKADYTLELANTIRIIPQDCEVIDILSGTPRKKLYDIKKTKTSLKGRSP